MKYLGICIDGPNEGVSYGSDRPFWRVPINPYPRMQDAPAAYDPEAEVEIFVYVHYAFRFYREEPSGFWLSADVPEYDRGKYIQARIWDALKISGNARKEAAQSDNENIKSRFLASINSAPFGSLFISRDQKDVHSAAEACFDLKRPDIKHTFLLSNFIADGGLQGYEPDKIVVSPRIPLLSSGLLSGREEIALRAVLSRTGSGRRAKSKFSTGQLK